VAVAFALRSIQGVQKFHNFTKLELVETPQTPILLKSSIHEVSKYMSFLFALSVQEGSKLTASLHFLRGQNVFGLRNVALHKLKFNLLYKT
jgi:hypothetical protein